MHLSLSISKWTAKTFMRVQNVEGNAHYAWLVTSVHSMAQKAGIEKMPEVGVYESPDVNAFATGPSKNNSLVAVSIAYSTEWIEMKSKELSDMKLLI